MRAQPSMWDISAPVHSATPVYPGDTPYQQHWNAQIGPDSAANVSTLTMSAHLGTHADAPLHYDAHGLSMGAVDLHPYLGPCRVVHAIGCGPRVQWSDLAHALQHNVPPRVIVRTYAQSPHQWDPLLSGIAPDALHRLADMGVQLIGTDSASVDPASSLRLESHMVVRERGMRILENLLLDAVPEGDYELIALPLKLMQADASPVRAILRTLA